MQVLIEIDQPTGSAIVSIVDAATFDTSKLPPSRTFASIVDELRQLPSSVRAIRVHVYASRETTAAIEALVAALRSGARTVDILTLGKKETA